VQATPDPNAAGAVLLGNGEDSAPTYGIAGLPTSISALAAAIAGSGVVFLAGCFASLSIRRRRRREAAG
jgi:amino acid transporter